MKGAPPYHSGTRTSVTVSGSCEALVFNARGCLAYLFSPPLPAPAARSPTNRKPSFISNRPMSEAVSNCHLWTYNQSKFFRGLQNQCWRWKLYEPRDFERVQCVVFSFFLFFVFSFHFVYSVVCCTGTSLSDVFLWNTMIGEYDF